MELLFIQEQHKAEFNRFVAAHPSGSFLQSWEWGEWQEQLGHRVERVLLKHNGQTAGTMQLIRITISRLGRHYFYCPYGPLLSEQLSTIDRQQSIEKVIRELQRKDPGVMFFRFEPKDDLEMNGTPTKHIQPGKTSIINLEQSVESILSRMRPKTRYNIKVAEKHGVSVTAESIITPGHGLHLKETLDLIIETAERQTYRSHPRSYYERLINFFAGHPDNQDCTLLIYKALKDNQLLATGIMIDFGSVRTYLFGGSSVEQRNVMAPHALHWRAMQDAKTNGMTHYDFWGIETASGTAPGFVKFKLGWGGETIQYPAALDIVRKPLWYNLYKLLRTVNRKF